MELVKSDPDHLHFRTNVIRTQIRRAAMEKNLGQFALAAEIYRTALAHLRKLESEGRLEGGRVSFIDSKTLEKEIALCEAARRPTD